MLTKIVFTPLPPPILHTPFIFNGMRTQEPVVLAPPIQMNPFVFPKFLYGPSITTATGATQDRSSQVLEQANLVSADPRQLLQIWA